MSGRHRNRQWNEGHFGGFTLIELLIVVAIIAILAAIAVPNLLEAQVRAKTSRCKSDLALLHRSLQASLVDRPVLLVDFWDDDHPEGIERGEKVFGIPIVQNDRGGTMGVLVPLTTPVAYLTSIPLDPFAQAGPQMPDLIEADRVQPWTYFYVDEDPKIPGQDSGGDIPLREGDYLFFSPGPDTSYLRAPGGTLFYDPTNGTTSEGNITYHSRSGFLPYDEP